MLSSVERHKLEKLNEEWPIGTRVILKQQALATVVEGDTWARDRGKMSETDYIAGGGGFIFGSIDSRNRMAYVSVIAEDGRIFGLIPDMHFMRVEETEIETEEEDQFLSDDHALLCGQVVGALLAGGVKATPIMDKSGNYTDSILVDRTSGKYEIKVVPRY